MACVPAKSDNSAPSTSSSSPWVPFLSPAFFVTIKTPHNQPYHIIIPTRFQQVFIGIERISRSALWNLSPAQHWPIAPIQAFLGQCPFKPHLLPFRLFPPPQVSHHFSILDCTVSISWNVSPLSLSSTCNKVLCFKLSNDAVIGMNHVEKGIDWHYLQFWRLDWAPPAYN